MLGDVFVVFGYCLRCAGSSQSAESSDPGYSRPRPACRAAAWRLLPEAIPLPPRLGCWRISGLMMIFKASFFGAQRRYDAGNIEN